MTDDHRSPVSVAFLVLRFVAFVALLPVYAVGYFLYLTGSMILDDEEILDDWPIEARCLLGWAMPVLIPLFIVVFILCAIWWTITDG